MLPGERKSVAPQNVRSAHQSMHHLVAEAPWRDAAMLSAVAGAPCFPSWCATTRRCTGLWTTRDFRKRANTRWGSHVSTAVRRVSRITAEWRCRCRSPRPSAACRWAIDCTCLVSGPRIPRVARRLGFPKRLTLKPSRPWRCARSRQPWRRVTRAGWCWRMPPTVTRRRGANSWPGTGTYAGGVRPGTTVWWGEHQPVSEPKPEGQVGRARRRLQRDDAHQPISVAELARALPGKQWRTVTWRKGVSEPLSSRFAQVRVRAAHRDQARDEEWVIIEWADGADEPAHYWFSNLPRNLPWPAMIDTVMGRWRIEREYEELKQELGLGHYEGRNWRGFHHHASLCIAAYGFLMLERLSGSKKTPLDSTSPTRRLLSAGGGGWGRCSDMSRRRSRPAASVWRAPSPERCCSVLVAGDK